LGHQERGFAVALDGDDHDADAQTLDVAYRNVRELAARRQNDLLQVEARGAAGCRELDEVHDTWTDDRVGDSQASEVVGRDHLVRAGQSQAPDARFGFAARVYRESRVGFPRREGDEDVVRLAGKPGDDGARAFHSSLLEDRFVERRAQHVESIRRFELGLQGRFPVHDDDAHVASFELFGDGAPEPTVTAQDHVVAQRVDGALHGSPPQYGA
jgi:hypothetical protein